jgi:hypothetical protein
MVSHGTFAVVAGGELPALSVGFGDGMFSVFMAECRLDVPRDDWPESEVVCVHCLIDEGDADLARGLDLAREHGQVDWDVDRGEWFVPDDARQNVG